MNALVGIRSVGLELRLSLELGLDLAFEFRLGFRVKFLDLGKIFWLSLRFMG